MLFPLGSLPDGPQIDTKKAILLLDFQNDFVSSDGKLHSENTAAFLPKLTELVSRFRENGEVVWARTEYRTPCPTISAETGGYSILLKQFVKQFQEFDDNNSGYATPRTDHEGSQVYSEPIIEPDVEAFLSVDLPSGSERCCLPGSWGSQYPEVVESAMNRQKDLLVTKSQYSAFADMSLLLQLRTRTVTDLYICGSMSNISVYATVLDAVRHGFGVTLIEDCLGFRDENCHFEAMRQMADSMCAEGIDYQELMDDLAGILGDVIREEDYTTRFHVDMSRPQSQAQVQPQSQTQLQQQPQSHTSDQHVNDWISIVESSTKRTEPTADTKGMLSNARPSSSGSEGGDDSPLSRTIRQRSTTLDSSPPRKRSTTDIDEPEEAPLAKLSNKASARRASHEPCVSRIETRGKKTRVRVRRSKKDRHEEINNRQSQATMQAYSTGDISDGLSSPNTVEGQRTEVSPTKPDSTTTKKKSSKKAPVVYLGPKDEIGDGTSKVIHDAVDDAFAEQAFEVLKTKVAWQKMYHRTGEVPRLVAVQGDIVESSMDNSTTFPVYRHPADESPELLPFDTTVEVLRQACELHVGHTLNHVLIQHYRNSEDNISEHSDKTLDIVRGSNIVNLSLGAQRTMTLRTKRTDATPNLVDQHDSFTNSNQVGTAREVQRVHLPHNSLFILSETTNAKYLHSIRADKRPAVEKLTEELAFNGERISLTFRHIGTYITKLADGKQTIWGQGAKGKTKSEAGPVLRGDNEAESQGEKMIVAFGRENHEDATFDWGKAYGEGFNVLNFIVKRVED